MQLVPGLTLSLVLVGCAGSTADGAPPQAEDAPTAGDADGRADAGGASPAVDTGADLGDAGGEQDSWGADTPPRAHDVLADGATADALNPHDALDASTVPELSGTWAQRQTTTARVSLPVIGDVIATTTATLRVEIAQSGTALTLTSETCDVAIDSGTTLVETIIPRAFVASLPTTARPATLDEADGAWVMAIPEAVDTRGAEIADPTTDPLPTDPADPRVVDMDGDGNPGVTVRVTGLLDGEIYVVQRLRSTLGIDLLTVDRLEGPITWREEQSILGTDNPLLRNPNPSEPLNTREQSYHTTVRVDPTLSCAGVLAAGDALFESD